MGNYASVNPNALETDGKDERFSMFRGVITALAMLLFGATSAVADICGPVHAALHLEAQLNSGDQPADILLPQIRDNARRLDVATRGTTGTFPAVVEQAILDYTQNVAAIHTTGGAATATMATTHISGQHRVLVRYLLAYTRDICPPPPADAAGQSQGGAAASDPGAASASDIFLDGGPKLISALLFIAISSLAFLALARHRRHRKRLSARHSCEFPVKVTFWGGAFDATAVDISCLGLKIETPQGQTMPQKMSLSFAGQTVHARIAWQNAFFAGLILSPKLPLSLMADLSEGEIKRGKRRARAARSGALRPSATDTPPPATGQDVPR